MDRNGFLDITPPKFTPMSHLKLEEVDINQIPRNILDGLIPADGREAPLTTDELQDGSRNEIWILQCPATAGLGQLLGGKKLYLDERQQFFDNGNKSYEALCVPHKNKHGDAALVPDESGKIQLVSFPVSGHIMIKEVTEDTSDVVPLPSPRKVHLLPDGLKVRHPVYGADYEIPEDPDPPPTKHKKKKRKTQEVEPANYEAYEPREVIPVAIVSVPPKEKSRKRKAQETEVVNHTVEDYEEIPRKKSKKRQTDPEEPQPIITIPDEPPKKKKKSVIKIELDSEVEISSPKKQKNHNSTIPEEPEIELEVIKRKKKKSSTNEQLFHQPEPVSSPKKKRKTGSS